MTYVLSIRSQVGVGSLEKMCKEQVESRRGNDHAKNPVPQTMGMANSESVRFEEMVRVLPLVRVLILTVCTNASVYELACAKTTHCTFLLLDVYSWTLPSYRGLLLRQANPVLFSKQTS